jgi:Tol biopolymer transport system component
MSIRQIARTVAVLFSTLILGCSSKTTIDVKDAGVQKDAVLRDLADARPDAPDTLPVSFDTRPDISDTLPASTDIVPVQPDAASADTGRLDSAEAGPADLSSAHDGLADSLQPIDQANLDVPYVADSNPADVRLGIDVVDVDGSAAGCNPGDGGSCGVCNPVAPGAPISFPVSDGVGKLFADPSGCLVYTYGWGTTQLVVFDAAQKKVLTRVELGGTVTDFSLSADGSYLVAILDKQQAIVVVNKASWTASQVATTEVPKSVAVDNHGVAYYVGGDWWDLRRIDLALGSSSEKGLSSPGDNRGADIALSSDGKKLYIAEFGSTGCNLYLLDVTTSTPTVVSHTTWNQGYGFGVPSGPLFVGPSGKYVYYADHQFDANNLGLIFGSAYHVFAEDSGARFVAAWYGILDARTLTTLIPLPNQIGAAAFVSADTELWTVSGSTITCTNVADLAAGKTLGLREGAASAIGDYSFIKLVADPVRPFLYGLDAKKRLVISIDRDTGTALRSVLVGSTPTDLEIDTSGTFIYTGHSDTYAIAQIDAATFSFVRFIPSPQDSYDIAPLGNNRIATVDEDQWTTPALVDLNSGTVTDSLRAPYNDVSEGALFATADGNSLFVGESGSTACNIVRYDVSGGKFTSVTSSYPGGAQGFNSPARSVVGTPDGTSIYYAGYCLDGTNLLAKRYAQTDQIISVTPSGALAVSSTKVYRVADGTALATLPSACSVQAVSPDSGTLYCASGSGIVTFSLAGLQ